MKILVVEDSPTMRSIIRKELTPGGYALVEANSAEKALDMLEAEQPDLVTLDIDLPGLDGFEFCRRLRAMGGQDQTKLSSIPVVMVTAQDSLEKRELGFEVGATEFISKPFVAGELLTSINSLLQPEALFHELTVLVADDSDVTRMVVRQSLQTLGVKILEADDGFSALALIHAQGTNLDLIITDYLMPGMTGAELCYHVKKHTGLGHVPVLALSGMTERGYILEMFKAGVTDFIIKPFAAEELRARVSVHLLNRALIRQQQNHIAKLKQLSQLKDRFLSIVSHDLRSPLVGIMGVAQILEKGSLSPEDQAEFAQLIRNSGNFLMSMVDDLLELGQMNIGIDRFSLHTLPLYEAAQSAVSTVSYMAKPKEVELVFDRDCPDSGLVEGDASAMLRIMNNLLSNAVKFSHPGGRVTVKLSCTEQQIQVTVTDTGIGMSPLIQATLFSEYSRISQPGTAGEKGTGLGLSITKKLVEMQNGTLTVDSTEGQGTTFHLAFPRAKIS